MKTNAPATSSRRRYRARKAAGICTQCGQVPAENGRRCCEPCRMKTNASSLKRQSKLRRLALVLNICRQCLQRLSMPSRRWCAICSEAHTERQQAKRIARRAAGLCPRCGGSRPCESCRKYQRERNQRYRARQRALGLCRVS